MNNNEIIMDLEDYKSILTHNGRIDGIVGTCKINEFNKLLDESLKKSLSKAKALTINAYNGVFEQCFQKYLNTFSKNKF